MSLVLDCLAIVEPGHHAPRAAQTFEQAQEESAAVRELNRAAREADERDRATARRAYAFRESGLKGVDTTLAQRRVEMCRCCMVRAAVGDGGLCTRRLCREVDDLNASSMRSEWSDKKAASRKASKKQRVVNSSPRGRREAALMDAAVARHKARVKS